MGSKVKFGSLCIKPCWHDTDHSLNPITLNKYDVYNKRKNPIEFYGHRLKGQFLSPFQGMSCFALHLFPCIFTLFGIVVVPATRKVKCHIGMTLSVICLSFHPSVMLRSCWHKVHSKEHWFGRRFIPFYAPESNDRGGEYCFCPVCLFVCLCVWLSVVNFNISYNFWRVRETLYLVCLLN